MSLQLCHRITNKTTKNYMEQKAPIGRDTLLWGLEFMGYYHLSDPRPWYVKLVHRYLDVTQASRHNLCVKAIDKVLRKLVKQ